MLNDMSVLATVAALALTAMVGIVWRFRVRSVKRWLAAWDAYAEREIAQQSVRVAPFQRDST